MLHSAFRPSFINIYCLNLHYNTNVRQRNAPKADNGLRLSSDQTKNRLITLEDLILQLFSLRHDALCGETTHHMLIIIVLQYILSTIMTPVPWFKDQGLLSPMTYVMHLLFLFV